ncbi:hypothetical protein [Fluviicola chungangensis]|uniref:RHS repeat protein n=1 Tax=Fluviicola chungangensis TaxID=2597671 RepID=A0A556N2F5_9FLAO|nr:hypothetical protein [Fluviicola chungangensis]TSJ46374.1 hypothetical protein FO442_04245 [Fluviicola chungangensis]
MQIIKTGLFILFTLVFSAKLVAQPFSQDQMDSVMLKKFKELGYHQMITTWNQTWSSYAGNPLKDIQTFNDAGLRIEHCHYNGIDWTRHKNEFDSTGNLTAFIMYDEKDTSMILSKSVYTYTDSMNFKKEYFIQGIKLLSTTTYAYTYVKDTLLLIETETQASSSFSEKRMSRYVQKGDSLQISEHVTFDENGKMDGISATYKIRRTDQNGNSVITLGNYEALIDKSFTDDSIFRADRLKNPDKYIQYQLDGNYPYKYSDDAQSTYIYISNPKGKLISRRDYRNRLNLYYNEEGKVIRTETYSKTIPEEKERKTTEQLFYYDNHGLPLKVLETDLESGKTTTYTFQFK